MEAKYKRTDFHGKLYSTQDQRENSTIVNSKGYKKFETPDHSKKTRGGCFSPKSSHVKKNNHMDPKYVT